MSAKIQLQSIRIDIDDTTRIDSLYIIRHYKNSKDRKNNSLISAKKMRMIIGSEKTWKKSVIARLDQIWDAQHKDIKLRRGIMFRISFR